MCDHTLALLGDDTREGQNQDKPRELTARRISKLQVRYSGCSLLSYSRLQKEEQYSARPHGTNKPLAVFYHTKICRMYVIETCSHGLINAY